MKYIIKIFLLVYVFSCSAELSSSTVSENEFWHIVADFDDTLLDKDAASEALTHLAELVATFEEPLARKELILRNIQFLEIHSSLEKLDDYLSGNLSRIGKDHNDYLRLYFNRLIINDLLGWRVVKKEVSRDSDSSWLSYYLALSLYLEPSEEAYMLVKEQCKVSCNFALLHIAIMEYFKSQGNVSALEQYSKEILNSVLDKTLIMNEPLMPQFAMAYLSFTLKMQSDKEAAEFFKSKSIENISAGSFMYLRLTGAAGL